MPHAFVPIPKCASVEMIYAYQGVVIENVFHVYIDYPYDLATLSQLRDVFDQWDRSYWSRSRTSACVLTRIRSKSLESATAPVEDYFLPTPRPGGLGGVPMPGNVTFCIKLATGLAGRSYRGRVYFPGIDHLIVSGNQIVPASGDLIVSWLTELIADLQLWYSRARLCVASYQINGVKRNPGLCTEVTQAVAVDYNLDSQRRRLTGRGI